jgi:hypothetical protein
VRRRAAGHTRFDHPSVGQLELRHEKLLGPEARQLLVVHHADQGSPSAEQPNCSPASEPGHRQHASPGRGTEAETAVAHYR